jgi:hypothetical protein
MRAISQPDGVQRGLVGNIIGRFEQRGYKLIALKLVHATEDHLKQRMRSQFLAGIGADLRSRLPRPPRQGLLPGPHQVHGIRPRRRHGLARSRGRQDRPFHARCHQPAGVRSWSVLFDDHHPDSAS